MEPNVFDALSQSIIAALTYFINTFSGLLQISVYLVIGTVFSYALIKGWQAFRALARFDVGALGERSLPRLEQMGAGSAPLSMIAASFFYQTKKHYLAEKRGDTAGHRSPPPDAFIRDAAYQYSERHFEEKFLEPISMMANLMPPLGFIGTIIGMVVHFLTGAGALSSSLTVAGIATALYTTFVGLVCYTILEFLLKVFSALARRRIDEGLAAMGDRLFAIQERKAA